VGIDLEPIISFPEMDDVLAEFLPCRQCRVVNETADRAAAFFEAWCRLEAAVKATRGVLDEGCAAMARTHQVAGQARPGLMLAVAWFPGPEARR
jgi:hypothetical protein